MKGLLAELCRSGLSEYRQVLFSAIERKVLGKWGNQEQERLH